MSQLINKIVEARKFNKKNKGKYRELNDSFDGHIILKVTSIGVESIEPGTGEEALEHICLDDDLLEFSGWKEHKATLIEEGVITIEEIEEEKKTDKIKQNTLDKLVLIQADDNLKNKLNKIRERKGIAIL